MLSSSVFLHALFFFFFNLFHFYSVLPDSVYTAIISFETTFILCLNNLKKKKKRSHFDHLNIMIL